jgi:hypothetical protein
MQIDRARQDILRWLMDFVEQPQSQLAGWPPCPFARQARLRNAIDFRSGTEVTADLHTMADIGDWQVVIWVYDADQLDHQQFDQDIQNCNQQFLASRDLIALGDHPRDQETVQGLSLNQGAWAMVLVQGLSLLDHHAQQLYQQGYYRGWPRDYLDLLFRGRRDPRSCNTSLPG